MTSWKDYLEEKLKDPDFKKAYNELEAEYSLISAMLNSREELGISQAQLSSMTGITQSDISDLEAGNANPSLSTLKKIAGALGKKVVIQFV